MKQNDMKRFPIPYRPKANSKFRNDIGRIIQYRPYTYLSLDQRCYTDDSCNSVNMRICKNLVTWRRQSS